MLSRLRRNRDPESTNNDKGNCKPDCNTDEDGNLRVQIQPPAIEIYDTFKNVKRLYIAAARSMGTMLSGVNPPKLLRFEE